MKTAEEPRTKRAMNPLLTIIIPTYNRWRLLCEALSTVLREAKGLPVEVIVVDDCSTDGTWDRLKQFDNTPILTCLRTTANSGPGPARNVGLAAARGRYIIQIDSDFLLIQGALSKVKSAIDADHGSHPILFFRCIEYPRLRVLDNFSGTNEITSDDMLYSDLGELLAVVDLDVLRSRDLRYPTFRSGGESIFLVQTLADRPGLFLDIPVVLYRTDVPNRICTVDHQIEHAADLACVADAILELFPPGYSSRGAHPKRKRLLASGTYHLLAGHERIGRHRLVSALAQGNLPALMPLVISFFGRRVFQHAFVRYCRHVGRAVNWDQRDVHPQ